MPATDTDVYESSAARIETLRKIPLFAHLSEHAFAHLAQVATEVRVPAEHVLLEPGQEGCGLVIVLEGTAEIHLGNRVIPKGPGEILGELTVLVDGLQHVARVQAATPMTCLAINREDFAELLQQHPGVALTLIPVLARRLAEDEALV